jgi:GNAT superfamily N-acetyltransferase
MHVTTLRPAALTGIRTTRTGTIDSGVLDLDPVEDSPVGAGGIASDILIADAIATTLAAAFACDPVTRWIIPDEIMYPTAIHRFFTVLAHDTLRHGTTDIIHDDARDPLAAALWYDNTSVTCPGPAAADPSTPDGVWRDALGPYTPRWTQLDQLMTAHHLTGPHWYLLAIGVRPDLHGCGLGSTLLNHRHQHLNGYAAYLESTTTASRRLYERHGYTCTGRLDIPDGPPLWQMHRPPALAA